MCADIRIVEIRIPEIEIHDHDRKETVKTGGIVCE
jgi:hypothetical protein